MLVQDGSPTTWSASELSDILAIWRAVSEDFAPWDVDVTTEDPGAAYLGVNGIRAAIGGAFGDCKCPALCIPGWKARFGAHNVASIDPQCSTGSHPQTVVAGRCQAWYDCVFASMPFSMPTAKGPTPSLPDCS